MTPSQRYRQWAAASRFPGLAGAGLKAVLQESPGLLELPGSTEGWEDALLLQLGWGNFAIEWPAEWLVALDEMLALGDASPKALWWLALREWSVAGALPDPDVFAEMLPVSDMVLRVSEGSWSEAWLWVEGVRLRVSDSSQPDPYCPGVLGASGLRPIGPYPTPRTWTVTVVIGLDESSDLFHRWGRRNELLSLAVRGPAGAGDFVVGLMTIQASRWIVVPSWQSAVEIARKPSSSSEEAPRRTVDLALREMGVVRSSPAPENVR